MTEYYDRDIYAHGSPLVPYDFLQSLFVSELMRPSHRLWISSPWISDVDMIDNSARQYASLQPGWPASHIRLSTVLASLLELGAEVVTIVNESPHNDDFLKKLAALQLLHGRALHVIRSPHLHEKGILGDLFTLNGSMNLTFNGVYINEEYLIYRTDPAKVAERRLTLESRWRGEL